MAVKMTEEVIAVRNQNQNQTGINPPQDIQMEVECTNSGVKVQSPVRSLNENDNSNIEQTSDSDSNDSSTNQEEQPPCIFDKATKVFTVGEFHGTIKSLSYLLEDQWIDDCLIHSMATYFIQQSKKPNVYLINSCLMFVDDVFPELVSADVQDISTFYIFLNPGGVHWILAQISMPTNTITTYDSLPSITSRHYDGLISDVKNKLSKMRAVDSWIVRSNSDCSIQENAYDCGIMALIFLYSLLHGKPLDDIHRSDVAECRLECAETLLKTTAKGLHFLETLKGNVELAIIICYMIANPSTPAKQ